MNLPALPLSSDRYPWMSDDGMSMLPDQKVMSLLADGLQEKMSFKPFMDFLGSIPKSSAAPKIAREWFAGSGLVEESEDEGRSIRPLVDMLSNENLFAGFQKILRKMPDADDMDAAMRESEIHNLSMTIAKTLLPEMHRAFEEIEAGKRIGEGATAPSRPSAPVRTSSAPARTSSAPARTSTAPVRTPTASPRTPSAPTRTAAAPFHTPAAHTSSAPAPKPAVVAAAPQSRPAEPDLEDEAEAPAAPIVPKPKPHDARVAVPTIQSRRHDGLICENVTLSEADKEIEPDTSELITYLPPPPENGTHEQNMAWVQGKPWSPYVFGVQTEGREELTVDEVMDLETDVHGNFDAYRSQSPHESRIALGNTVGYAEFLERAGNILGSDPEREHGRRALTQSFDNVIERISPELIPGLKKMQARLVIPDELARLATIAYDIAEDQIGNGFGQGEQRFEGSINGNARVIPESVLDRAVFAHLVMGTPMSETLVDGLIELYGAKDFHEKGNDALGLSSWEKYFYDSYGGEPELKEVVQEDTPEDDSLDMSF